MGEVSGCGCVIARSEAWDDEKCFVDPSACKYAPGEGFIKFSKEAARAFDEFAAPPPAAAPDIDGVRRWSREAAADWFNPGSEHFETMAKAVEDAVTATINPPPVAPQWAVKMHRALNQNWLPRGWDECEPGDEEFCSEPEGQYEHADFIPLSTAQHQIKLAFAAGREAERDACEQAVLAKRLKPIGSFGSEYIDPSDLAYDDAIGEALNVIRARSRDGGT